MRYTSIIRELMTRIDFHSKNAAPGLDAPLLEGLTQMQAGEWQVNGEENLPNATVANINVQETAGKASASIAILFSTSRDKGFVQLTDSADTVGLVDWGEKVMDALCTKPSDGQPDQLLVPHNTDGTLAPCGGMGTLLGMPFEMSLKMARITDLSYTAEVEIRFTPVLTARANRRRTPIAKLE
jgi:hypothetical protein